MTQRCFPRTTVLVAVRASALLLQLFFFAAFRAAFCFLSLRPDFILLILRAFTAPAHCRLFCSV